MLNKILLKRSLSSAIALTAAIILSRYFALAEIFWLPLSTFFVMQTAVSVPLRQGLEHYFWMLAGALSGTMVAIYLPHFWLQAFVWVIVFCIAHYLKTRECAWIFMIAMLLPDPHTHMVFSRAYDITLGAILGMAAHLTIFPARIDDEFRHNLVPVLRAYSAYYSAIIDQLLQKENAAAIAHHARIEVEDMLQTEAAFFPEWVYQSGLSFPLRSGYRHFLIMIERVGQILFSLHQGTVRASRFEAVAEIEPALQRYSEAVKNVFAGIICVLELKKLPHQVSDLSQELSELSFEFSKILPSPLELLDLRSDETYLAACLADLQDLRICLLQLGEALILRENKA